MLLEELTCDAGLALQVRNAETRTRRGTRAGLPSTPPETPSSPKVNDRLISGLASTVSALDRIVGELVECVSMIICIVWGNQGSSPVPGKSRILCIG